MTNTIGATPEERELIEKLWLLASGHLRMPAPPILIEAGILLESLISDRAKLREALEAALREIPATCSAYQDGWAALTGQSNGE